MTEPPWRFGDVLTLVDAEGVWTMMYLSPYCPDDPKWPGASWLWPLHASEKFDPNLSIVATNSILRLASA